MAFYKKKYYKPTLVKANNDYKCEISGLPIEKGDHYLLLQIEDSAQRFTQCGHTYTPTKTIRVSRRLLGTISMEQILEKTNLFEKEDETIVRLEKEISVLKHIIRLFTCGDKK